MAECQWKDWEASALEHAERSTRKLGRKARQLEELQAALEAAEREVLALELGGRSSKGYESSSAPSSEQSSPAIQEGPKGAIGEGQMGSMYITYICIYIYIYTHTFIVVIVNILLIIMMIIII